MNTQIIIQNTLDLDCAIYPLSRVEGNLLRGFVNDGLEISLRGVTRFFLFYFGLISKR